MPAASRPGVHLDLGPLEWLTRKWTARNLPAPLPTKWAKRYSAFVRRRFMREGDGTWKKLAESTLRQRKKEGKGAKILQNVGITLNALEIGAAGNLFKNIKHGIRFGFGGPARRRDGHASIAKIAIYHDQGGPGGRPPQRKIIVKPNQAVVRGLVQDVVKVNRGLMRSAQMRLRRGFRRGMRVV